jgi:hypothetical protein
MKVGGEIFIVKLIEKLQRPVEERASPTNPGGIKVRELLQRSRFQRAGRVRAVAWGLPAAVCHALMSPPLTHDGRRLAARYIP